MKKLSRIMIFFLLATSLFSQIKPEDNTPRGVYVALVDHNGNTFDFSTGKDNVTYEMWIESRPEEIQDDDYIGIRYLMLYHEVYGAFSYIASNLGNFLTNWAPGEILVIKPRHYINENEWYECENGTITFELDSTLNAIFIGLLLPPVEEPIILGELKTSIDSEIVPEYSALEQNYPNPFNPTTRINYSLEKKSKVKLTVFDIKGSVVTELVNSEKLAGFHSVKFDASSLNSGIYYYFLKVDGINQSTKKMTLIK